MILHGRVKKIYPSRSTKNGYEYSYFSMEVKKHYRSKDGEQKTQTTDVLCCKFGEPPQVAVDDMVMVQGSLSSKKEENTHKTSVVINELSITSASQSRSVLPHLPPLEDPPF